MYLSKWTRWANSNVHAYSLEQLSKHGLEQRWDARPGSSEQRDENGMINYEGKKREKMIGYFYALVTNDQL
ncbi:unnamed protein product [Allacma fusca]|uniref:Uncharacterized protein n=1 Tax=Allacma fusca TaxID=39272 RepID=A0A8J2KYS2_9HEXA|nr:unnamed protein product [Allacma fusca]